MRRLLLSLPVALAFADASIVLLALPEIVARLHTSISHVIWVIVVYNLALIAGSIAVRFAPRRPAVERLLVAGLLLFGVASLASGLAGDLTTLLIARGFQGIGGAVLLCASLPPMARASAAGDASPLRTWSAAAAIGAAIGSRPQTLISSSVDKNSAPISPADSSISARLARIAATVEPASAVPSVRVSTGAGSANRGCSGSERAISQTTIAAAAATGA